MSFTSRSLVGKVGKSYHHKVQAGLVDRQELYPISVPSHQALPRQRFLSRKASSPYLTSKGRTLAATSSGGRPKRKDQERIQVGSVSLEAPKRVRLQSELFRPVMDQVRSRVEGSESFRELVDSYRSEGKSLKIVCRDELDLTGDFAMASKLCSNMLVEDYIAGILDRAFARKQDDWLAVVSTTEDNTQEPQLQGFVVGKLGAATDINLPAVWEVSLLCDAKLRNVGFVLVQSFVYAAKMFAVKHKTTQAVALDLENAYDNMQGLGMFAKIGFSSLSPLLKTVLAPIIDLNTRNKHRRVVVDDTSLPMGIDLADLSPQTLLGNIGVHTSQPLSFNTNIDMLLFTAFKLANILGEEQHQACINARKRAYHLATQFYLGDVSHTHSVLHKYLAKLVQQLASQVTQKYTKLLT